MSTIIVNITFIIICINPLTAAIQGSDHTFFVKWRRYPGARLERYLQNGAIIRGPARMLPEKWRRYPDARLYTGPRFKSRKSIFYIMISMVLL